MTVHVVTDSTSCLPPALAAEYGITVLDIHTRGRLHRDTPDDTTADETDAATGTPDDGADADATADDADTPEDDGDADDTADEDPTTAGLGPLELTAAYARLLERGGDDGVVAIHLSRELSSTWSSATQAAAVFGGLVDVLDTRSAGMVLGQAAIAAARRAAAGADLAECSAAARRVLDGANVWLYVHRLDALARGGRLSTAQRLLSTALAIKPILHLAGGKIELAAKTRTQTRAMGRLVNFAEEAYREIATPVVVPPESPADTIGSGDAVTGDAPEQPQELTSGEITADTVPEDAAVETVAAPGAPGAADGDRPRVFTFGGDHEFRLRKRREEPVPLRDLPAVPMHLDIHQAGYPELAEELRETLRAELPDSVVVSVVDLSPALLVHTGPEAVGITLVHD